MSSHCLVGLCCTWSATVAIRSFQSVRLSRWSSVLLTWPMMIVSSGSPSFPSVRLMVFWLRSLLRLSIIITWFWYCRRS